MVNPICPWADQCSNHKVDSSAEGQPIYRYTAHLQMRSAPQIGIQDDCVSGWPLIWYKFWTGDASMQEEFVVFLLCFCESHLHHPSPRPVPLILPSPVEHWTPLFTTIVTGCFHQLHFFMRRCLTEPYMPIQFPSVLLNRLPIGNIQSIILIFLSNWLFNCFCVNLLGICSIAHKATLNLTNPLKRHCSKSATQ